MRAASHLLLTLLLGAAPVLRAQHEVADSACGFAITLPSADWKLQDHSGQGAVVHIYSPTTPPVPRVTLLRIPAAFLPDGLATRASQMRAMPALQCEPVVAATLAGRDAQQFEYTGGGVRHIERALLLGDAYTILQIAAKPGDWQEPQRAAAYEQVWTSARLVELAAPVKLSVDPKTPEQVRQTRAALEPAPQPFELRAHDLQVRIEPATGRVEVRDELTIAARGQEVAELELFCTLVEIDGIRCGDQELQWEKQDDRTLRLQLAQPLAPGAETRLQFTAHAEKFHTAVDQKLVAEIAVFGQVEPTSSFTSHVLYYPVDQRNDAQVRIALSVPHGYVAVSGGNALGSEQDGDRVVFRYEEPLRTPRLLPFGFAVARYEVLRDELPSGLQLEIWHPQHKQKEAAQRMRIARICGELFEQRMGPLPWRRVAFCWVAPTRKETGVSLPGQVLVSDGFFRDASGVELSGARLNDPQTLGPLLIADELSHQWNAYAVPLPNELAEGISTFTNLLFLEVERGREEYRRGIEFCAHAYRAVAADAVDVALADPGLYRSSVYRVVAFCKVPAVLDLLRHRLGEERFWRAWKHVFTTLRGERGGYAPFVTAFGAGAEAELAGFFDQWFFQAGHPQPQVRWSQRAGEQGPLLTLAVEQAEPGGLFEFQLVVEADCGAAGKIALEPLAVTQRSQSFERALPAEARDVTVRAEADSPLIPVTVAAADR